MAKLTKRVVDDARPGTKPYIVWCSELPGFGARIFPTGRKVYYADYRAAGVRRRMAIGPHGILTTEEARKLAIKTLGEAVRGGDPVRERRTRRQSMTVSELCDKYVAATRKGLIFGRSGRPKKASTLATDYGRIERHIKPLLGGKLVVELTPSDIARFIRDVTAGKTAVVEKSGKKRGKAVVEGGPGTASRTAGLLGGILTYAVSDGIIPHSPSRGVKRPADRRRQRRLLPDEYEALGAALDAAETETWQAIAGIRLLALTGCRLGEIIGLKWQDVDLDAAALRLGDSKTGQSVRPIGRPAIELFKALPGSKSCEWVLPAARAGVKEHFGGMPGAVQRIAKAADLKDFSAHVLRHSFASIGGDLDYSEATIGAIIGHAGQGITSRYVHRLDAVLVAAADAIAAEVARQLDGNKR